MTRKIKFKLSILIIIISLVGAAISGCTPGAAPSSNLSNNNTSQLAIDIEPKTATINVGEEKQFDSYLVFSDGHKIKVTDKCTWDLKDPSIAEKVFTNGNEVKGLFRGLKNETCNVTATLDEQTLKSILQDTNFYRGATIYSPSKSLEIFNKRLSEDKEGVKKDFDVDPDTFKKPLYPEKDVPTIDNVITALDSCGYYNKDAFKSLNIYILPYVLPAPDDNARKTSQNTHVSGLLSKVNNSIYLFAMGDEKDKNEHIIIHELGHFIMNETGHDNPVEHAKELTEYINWRLYYKNTGQIIPKSQFDLWQEVVAEDFSWVYGPGEQVEKDIYEHVVSPQNDPELKKEIKKRFDKIFKNEKV